MENLVLLWGSLLKARALRHNYVNFKRIQSVQKSIAYISSNKKALKTKVTKLPQHLNKREKLELVLGNAQTVLKTLEEEVLFNPTQYFSTARRNECLHFTCDAISYVIEHIELKIAELNH